MQVLISAAQLKHLLGMPIPRGSLPETLWYAATHAQQINPAAVVTGLLGVGLLAACKAANRRWWPRVALPEQLLLLALATCVSWACGLERRPHDATQLISVPVVGAVHS